LGFATGSVALVKNQIEGRVIETNFIATLVIQPESEFQRRYTRNENDGLFRTGPLLPVFEHGRKVEY